MRLPGRASTPGRPSPTSHHQWQHADGASLLLDERRRAAPTGVRTGFRCGGWSIPGFAVVGSHRMPARRRPASKLPVTPVSEMREGAHACSTRTRTDEASEHPPTTRPTPHSHPAALLVEETLLSHLAPINLKTCR